MSKKEQFIPIILVMVITIGLVGFVGCGSEPAANAQEKKDKEKEEAIPVEVTTVEKGNIFAYFSGTASLESENEARVVAKVGGVVEKIFVEEGDRVRAEQVLAQLDDDKAALDLAEAEARLKQLESEFKRKEELYQKKIISTEIFERIKSDYEMQKAKVGQARLIKEYTSIRAPINGVIAERMIKVGNMVPLHEPCFHITDFDPLLAILHVPEKDMSKLKKNQKGVIQVDALPGEDFSGKILRISPVVDPQTSTFKVTVAVTDPEEQLKAGMFARVRIAYDVHNDTNLVPKDAVLTEGNESVVFVVDPKENTAQRKVVEIGYVNTTHMEITGGVNPGDTLVQTGIGGLKDGSKVDVLNPPAGAVQKPGEEPKKPAEETQKTGGENPKK
ncbi:MAG: efflux RND transporter periplasmic adaptor subunit [Candidatus Aminicenantes bacterium]|nr:efflux RND transporter periplasmic adaptor subunit [Candidatus Aminicenantes bacterium]NIM82423.1 efflux RND transporter periplasmic adaptor subunit [Candidatus Aminicenantes bacterium]NIN21783.1 efflux RND transporter periplasmic adaptor subunit [Candidatus Aminicenantes bacterium]NIN45575.1 efflux RND transporter periplasmic adaptor subunit [Candidatus Aminicenantes bacterium]NIN88406.1 efflux RND transporter periplasmic adaptor subunit [Candidatus Aminicenantes bacterium]